MDVDLLQCISRQVGSWSKWTKRLADRQKPQPLRKLLGPQPILWGLSRREISEVPLVSQLAELRRRNTKSSQRDWNETAASWCDASLSCDADRKLALDCLAWCHALPRLARKLDKDQWKQLLAILLTISNDAEQADRSMDALAHLLLAGELPLALCYVFPELEVCASRRVPGRQVIAKALDELLDGEGVPHSAHLASLQPLLACGVRALAMDREVKKGRIEKSARLQVDWMTRQTLRFSRADGSTILGPTDDESPYYDPLLQAALEITGDQSDRMTYKVLRAQRKPTSATLADLPEPSEHSEWSELAVLRTDWTPDQCYLAVDFARNKLDIELAAAGKTVLSGSSLPQIAVHDQPLQITSDWEIVCWESDRDMDYIELEAHLQDDWRVQRQMLLARKDRFAFIADAVLGPTCAAITYQQPLPLADSICLEQPDETTEAFLLGPKRLGTVVPIAASEWKNDSRDGRLVTSPGWLEMSATAGALYAPLFIDLDPSRRRKALTWRCLTVGEDLQIVPGEVAVAYRMQIGKRQWVFYRALTAIGNRTFLGINLTSEFLAARFGTDGEIEPLIDIAG